MLPLTPKEELFLGLNILYSLSSFDRVLHFIFLRSKLNTLFINLSTILYPKFANKKSLNCLLNEKIKLKCKKTHLLSKYKVNRTLQMNAKITKNYEDVSLK